MLNILVAGGFNEENAEQLPHVEEFARLLGGEVITQGHVLVNGCSTGFDRTVAEGAAAVAKERGKDPKECIVSYCLQGQDPAHALGNVRRSQLVDWELGNPRLRIPEPIELADAVVLVGGFTGTHRAANWARINGKPILPVPRFGDAAEVVFAEELSAFEQKYAGRITKSEFSDLAQVTSEPADLARTVISLAERVQASQSVFMIMSFTNDPALEDLYESCKEVCVEEGYDYRRVDDESSVPRILQAILARISECAFAIVDLTDEKANVYYELGYAQALDKPVIVTAKIGTNLPFDVKDIPVIFWENQTGFKKQLRKKAKEISARQGR
jgi:predicted Rossmann-fold nucleotide-binding protein